MPVDKQVWTARIIAATKKIKSQLTVRELAYDLYNELGPACLPDVPKAVLLDLCMDVDYAGEEHITFRWVPTIASI